MSVDTPPAALLLGRPEFSAEIPGLAEFVHGRRILVTGAAGSVGWPLVHALHQAAPGALNLVDHHEHSLFSLERSLGLASANLSYELADVRDATRMQRIFEKQRPEIIFHLAAAKHVPYGERFPEGAVATNVLATQSLLELASTYQAEHFVYPSSDKSVQPPSVYGATKRVAEALVQQHVLSSTRQWAIVRFVNIIGTRGSVVETFTQQVLADRPLSVTDERMTRYWISMAEAVWCLLTASKNAPPGEVVMPACGEPVPIVETARLLAGWYRPEQVPYPIKCTGIRPGERLHEVLLSPNETFAAGPVPGLRAVRTSRPTTQLNGLPRLLDDLQRMVDSGEREELVRACLAAAEALQ